MKIHISSDCKKYLDDLGGWIIERRGIIDVKVTLLQQQQPVHNTASSPQFTDIRYVARPLSCSVFFSPDDLNPFEIRGNYSATWNNMKVVHWPLMSGLLHLVQRGWDWAGPQLASPLITVILTPFCILIIRLVGPRNTTHSIASGVKNVCVFAGQG